MSNNQNMISTHCQPSDQPSNLLSWLLTKEAYRKFGIEFAGPRVTSAEYGGYHDAIRDYQVICSSAEHAEALRAEFTRTGNEYVFGTFGMLSSTENEKICTFFSHDIIKVHEAAKLRAALAQRFNLSDDEASLIKIAVVPLPTNIVPNTSIAIKVPRNEKQRATSDNIFTGLRNLLNDQTLFTGSYGDPDIPGDFWPDQFVDTQKLYEALKLELPAYLEPQQNRIKSDPAPTVLQLSAQANMNKQQSTPDL